MHEIFTKDKIYGAKTFCQYIKEKKVGIWGCGSGGEKVKCLLQELNVNVYKYFDKDKNKHNDMITSPEYIKDNINFDWFIIVASTYYDEIKYSLEKLGLSEYTDFVNGLDINNQLNFLKYSKEQIPDLSFYDLTKIEEELEKKKIKYKHIKINQDKLETLRNKFDLDQMCGIGFNKRYYRKVLEYYFAYELLQLKSLKKNEVYVDVGACSSPWVDKLRRMESLNAYAIDLDESEEFADSEYYLQQDATKTDFLDDSVTVMSLQSSFELFANNGDLGFIKECSRILKKDGKVMIAPLYLHNEYITAASPQFYDELKSENGSVRCIRNDAASIQMSRFYNVAQLKSRIISQIEKCDLQYIIYILDNNEVEKDGFIYLKFILEIIK